MTSFATAYDDGYQHGLRGLSVGCSYYYVGTALHREYERGHTQGWIERLKRITHEITRHHDYKTGEEAASCPCGWKTKPSLSRTEIDLRASVHLLDAEAAEKVDA